MTIKVVDLDENIIAEIGHAFGYYDYGNGHELIDAFPSRDAAAAFICSHVRMTLAGTCRFGEYGVLYDLIKYPNPTS